MIGQRDETNLVIGQRDETNLVIGQRDETNLVIGQSDATEKDELCETEREDEVLVDRVAITLQVPDTQ